MEKFFSIEYGIAGICVMLTIMVLTRVAEFAWGLREKKETLSEASIEKLASAVENNTKAIQALIQRLERVETLVSEIPKFKTDVRRFYSAIKELAGEDWPKIRDEIMKDELVQ